MSVYWVSSQIGQAPRTMKVPIGGGTPVVVGEVVNLPDFPTIAVSPTNVYWTNDETIATCPISGCGATPAQPFSESDALNVVVDATNIYWTNAGSQSLGYMDGSISTCPLGGCSNPTVLVTGGDATAAFFLAADALNLYWTTTGTAANQYMDAKVVQMAKTGGTPIVLGPATSAGKAHIGNVAVDATTVYWGTGGNGAPFGVMKCAIGGCGGNPTVIPGTQQGPYGFVAVDGKNVYFTGTVEDASSSVMKCAVDGCSSPTALGPGLLNYVALAVDANNVYIASAGTAPNMYADGQVYQCPK